MRHSSRVGEVYVTVDAICHSAEHHVIQLRLIASAYFSSSCESYRVNDIDTSLYLLIVE